MNAPKGYSQYQGNQIDNASPAEAVALLLEKCVREARQAKQARESKQMEVCVYHCDKIATIIDGLKNSLNSNTQDAISMSKILVGYYNMISQLLMQVCGNQDPLQSADNLIESLSEMAETWRQVDSQLKKTEAEETINPDTITTQEAELSSNHTPNQKPSLDLGA